MPPIGNINFTSPVFLSSINEPFIDTMNVIAYIVRNHHYRRRHEYNYSFTKYYKVIQSKLYKGFDDSVPKAGYLIIQKRGHETISPPLGCFFISSELNLHSQEISAHRQYHYRLLPIFRRSPYRNRTLPGHCQAIPLQARREATPRFAGRPRCALLSYLKQVQTIEK